MSKQALMFRKYDWLKFTRRTVVDANVPMFYIDLFFHGCPVLRGFLFQTSFAYSKFNNI